MRRTIRAMETKEKVDGFTKCRWCKQIVDREECFAEPLTKNEETIWVCYCGKPIPDQEQTEKSE
mgnify:CR=1 FL=1